MSAPIVEDRDQAALDALRELADRPDPTDFDEELFVAADFVFRHGSLGDRFDEPQLAQLQFGFGAAGSAYALIGHWSVERGDPLNLVDGPGDRFDAHTDGCATCRFLESARGLGDSFQYELCEVCGLDIDEHAVAGDPLGNPSSFCLTPFELEDGAPFDNGDQNDMQHGDALGTRWRARIAGDEGLWAVVTRTYYVLDHGDGRMELVRDDEYIACTDPANPGDSEVGSSGRVVSLESDDPAAEDLVKLCNEAVYPSQQEWRKEGVYWHGTDLLHPGQSE